MAFRLLRTSHTLLTTTLRSAGTTLHARSQQHAPKVTEAMVALTAFTEEGVRVPILGRVGTTLQVGALCDAERGDGEVGVG
jgi:hypothetical protein